jgi:hypothetical protein
MTAAQTALARIVAADDENASVAETPAEVLVAWVPLAANHGTPVALHTAVEAAQRQGKGAEEHQPSPGRSKGKAGRPPLQTEAEDEVDPLPQRRRSAVAEMMSCALEAESKQRCRG